MKRIKPFDLYITFMQVMILSLIGMLLKVHIDRANQAALWTCFALLALSLFLTWVWKASRS